MKRSGEREREKEVLIMLVVTVRGRQCDEGSWQYWVWFLWILVLAVMELHWACALTTGQPGNQFTIHI